MAQEDTIAPMPAYAYAILAAESQCALAYCALARHLSGGRRSVLAGMEDGGNDGSKQARDYRRPPDPKAHLRKEGQVNKLLGERRDHETRTRDVVMRPPALTAVGAHGDEHYHQHRDSGGEGVRQQGVPERAPSQARDERRSQREQESENNQGYHMLAEADSEGDAARKQDHQAQRGHADRLADARRSVASRGQFPRKIGSEDKREPENANDGSAAARGRTDPGFGPMLKLADQTQNCEHQGNHRRNHDQLSDTD